MNNELIRFLTVELERLKDELAHLQVKHESVARSSISKVEVFVEKIEKGVPLETASDFLADTIDIIYKNGKLVGKDFSKLKPKRLPKDAAIVQSARNYMVKEITKLVPNTTNHDSWLTKYNRDELGLPKEHYYDALSVGEVPSKFNFLTNKVLVISAKGK